MQDDKNAKMLLVLACGGRLDLLWSVAVLLTFYRDCLATTKSDAVSNTGKHIPTPQISCTKNTRRASSLFLCYT